MNWIPYRSLRVVLACALTGAFIIAGEMPLLALPQQQSTSASTSSQKGDESLPDAPQSQTTTQDQSATVPSGAAGAKAANPKGSPVAQPVGAAVAPIRQRSHRSLLIKLGLVAGVGIAVGTAVALSAGSPSRPPGTSPATR